MRRRLDAITLMDIKEAFAGKLFAFTAVVGRSGCCLGVAVANESGYSPVPEMRFSTPRYDDAATEAERLNKEMGLSDTTSMKIVMSTMRGKVQS